MSASNNRAWREIWETKGRHGGGDLHQIDGNDLLSLTEWENTVATLIKPLALHPGMSVVELGCGAGAFLAALKRIEPGLRITGLDYAASMIAIAGTRLTGEFFVGDIRDCPALASASADIACSFGVLLYLDSEADVSRALEEIDRVARPGGKIYVGEISDLAKRDLALQMRRSTHANHKRVSPQDLQHLYLSREFVLSEAKRLGWNNVRIVDHADLPALASNPLAGYRFSVYADKAGETS